jgi:hypothetical protein
VRARAVAAWAVVAQGVAARVVAAQVVAARVPGARAGSAVVLPGLDEKEHRAAIVLQQWQPDRIDEGIGGVVSWLRRLQLVSGKLV